MLSAGRTRRALFATDEDRDRDSNGRDSAHFHASTDVLVETVAEGLLGEHTTSAPSSSKDTLRISSDGTCRACRDARAPVSRAMIAFRREVRIPRGRTCHRVNPARRSRSPPRRTSSVARPEHGEGGVFGSDRISLYAKHDCAVAKFGDFGLEYDRDVSGALVLCDAIFVARLDPRECVAAIAERYLRTSSVGEAHRRFDRRVASTDHEHVLPGKFGRIREHVANAGRDFSGDVEFSRRSARSRGEDDRSRSHGAHRRSKQEPAFVALDLLMASLLRIARRGLDDFGPFAISSSLVVSRSQARQRAECARAPPSRAFARIS